MGLSRPLLGIALLMRGAVADSSFFPPDFTRIRWHSTLVEDNWLYVDGGEIYNKTGNDDLTFLVSGSTLAFDLSSPWTNSTVEPFWVPKPREYPLTRWQRLWYNPEKLSLQTFGGWQWASSDCAEDCVWLPDGTVKSFEYNLPALWTLDVRSQTGDGDWNKDPDQAPGDITPDQGSLIATTNDKLFALGGFSFVYDSAFANPGIVTLDWASNDWSNETAGSPAGEIYYAAYGEAIFIPHFGEEGVIIYIGGYAPASQTFNVDSDSAPRRPMNDILIYDVANDNFIRQFAFGDIPPSRWGFCATGVRETGSRNFDIFIHGGCATSQNNESYDEQLANIYVLSLPSFRWIKIPDSRAKEMRCLVRCNTVGNSQMVAIGGDDPTQSSIGYTSDPWTNGIGIYDMVRLRWSSSYDPDAPEYTRPDVIAKVNTVHPIPKWTLKGTQDIFHPPLAPENSHPYLSQATQIGLGVGVSAAALIGAGVLFFLVRRRYKKRIRWQRDFDKDKENDAHTPVEGKSPALEAGMAKWRSAVLGGEDAPSPAFNTPPRRPSELEDTRPSEFEERRLPPELETRERPGELEARERPGELQGSTWADSSAMDSKGDAEELRRGMTGQMSSTSTL